MWGVRTTAFQKPNLPAGQGLDQGVFGTPLLGTIL